jgi:hypothetical protein
MRCFDYNKLKIAKDKKCGDHFVTNLRLPAEFCDEIIGPHVTDYAVENVKTIQINPCNNISL